MQILCELKRFKEQITRGKYAGGETEYSISVGGDNYSWNIVKVTHGKSTPPIGQKYFKGFCHLLEVLPQFGVDPDKAIGKIVAALEKNTGIEAGDELIDTIATTDDYKKIGEAIDSRFKCNYNLPAHDSGKQTDPDRIYVRVLKANLKNLEKANA